MLANHKPTSLSSPARLYTLETFDHWIINCAGNLTSQYGSIDEIVKGGSQMAMVDRIIRKITHHSGPPVNEVCNCCI